LTSREFRRQLRRYAKFCFSSAIPVRASGFAEFLGLPRTDVSRNFHHVCGLRLSHAIRAEQVAEAKRQLRKTRRSTAQIAARAGFGAATTFYEVFLATVGVTPTEYRLDARD
jgi:AraC-like DNA-binding protein